MQLAKLDLLFSAFTALFGCYLVFEAVRFGVTSDVGPGSGTFPLVAGVFVLVFSLANLLRILRAPIGSVQQLVGRIQGNEVARVVGTIVLIGIYIWCFPALGAFLPLPLLFIGISLMIDWRTDPRWLATLLVIALMFTALCYLVFDSLLHLLLPTGPFGI